MDEVEELIAGLDNPRARARLRAAKRLGKLGDVRAVPALIGRLNDESELGYRAVDALMAIAEANPGNAEVLKAVPGLFRKLKGSGEEFERGRVAEVLGAIIESNPQNGKILKGIPALVEALNDPDHRVQRSAVKAITNIRKANPGNATVSNAVPALVGMLKDREWHYAREKIEEALVVIGAPAVHAVANLLEDEGLDARMNAVNILAQIGAPAVPALVGALNDADYHLRLEINNALHDIGHAIGFPAVPALVGALNDGNKDMRYWAAEALGNIADGCDTLESLRMFEEKLKEGAAALRKFSRSKDDVHDAMTKVVELCMAAAAKKNKLAGAGMKGLMLAGERPKPPKGGGMYRSAERKRAMGCR